MISLVIAQNLSWMCNLNKSVFSNKSVLTSSDGNAAAVSAGVVQEEHGISGGCSAQGCQVYDAACFMCLPTSFQLGYFTLFLKRRETTPVVFQRSAAELVRASLDASGSWCSPFLWHVVGLHKHCWCPGQGHAPGFYRKSTPCYKIHIILHYFIC